MLQARPKKGTLIQTAISTYQPDFSRSPKSQVFWLLILLIGFSRVSASSIKQAKLCEPVTWNFRNPSYSGNPFDLVVKASFTHTSGGQNIRTEFFYDSGDTWVLHFTGTHTGQWDFVIKSADPELNGLKGDCDPDKFHRRPDRIDADIREFFVGHGFNGFHITVLGRCFDLEKTRSNEITSSDPNPDPRTFEALELLIQKVHAANGGAHLGLGR